MLGKIEGRRRRGQRMRCLDGITDSMTWVWAHSGRWWRRGKPVYGVGLQRVRHNWVTEQQKNFFKLDLFLKKPTWPTISQVLSHRCTLHRHSGNWFITVSCLPSRGHPATHRLAGGASADTAHRWAIIVSLCRFMDWQLCYSLANAILGSPQMLLEDHPLFQG